MAELPFNRSSRPVPNGWVCLGDAYSQLVLAAAPGGEMRDDVMRFAPTAGPDKDNVVMALSAAMWAVLSHVRRVAILSSDGSAVLQDKPTNGKCLLIVTKQSSDRKLRCRLRAQS